ncbi:hypothetical protein Bca101_020701 [Brassica carinata]
MESTHYADHHAVMLNFCGTRLNEDSMSTVHLCVGTNCLIIQLGEFLEACRCLCTRVPAILVKHFGNEIIRFFGISNGGHANKLKK